MLKLTVVDVERDRITHRFGGERELLEYLRSNYPPTWGQSTMDRALQVLNDSDLYQAKVEPYEPPLHQLPEDYLTHSQADAEDPWPRKG